MVFSLCLIGICWRLNALPHVVKILPARLSQYRHPEFIEILNWGFCINACRTPKQRTTPTWGLFILHFRNEQHLFHMETLLGTPNNMVMGSWPQSAGWLQQMRSDMRMHTPRLWRNFLSLTLMVPCWPLQTWWGRRFQCLLTWCMMDRMSISLTISHLLPRGLGFTLLRTMLTLWSIW